MPKSTFSGVRLQLVGPMSVNVAYSDVVSMETFLKMKEACDAVVEPKLVPEAEAKSDKGGKGNT